MELANKVQDLCMHINNEQEYLQVSQRILPERHTAGILKKVAVKPKATTTNFTGITVSYRCRWNLLLNKEFEHPWSNNTSICTISKKLLGEVMNCYCFLL